MIDLPEVAGGRCLLSLAEFEHRARLYLKFEQEKPLPDNALIAVLCDAVRLARENKPLADVRRAERERCAGVARSQVDEYMRAQWHVITMKARARGDFETADAIQQHLLDMSKTHWAPGGCVAFVRKDAENLTEQLDAARAEAAQLLAALTEMASWPHGGGCESELGDDRDCDCHVEFARAAVAAANPEKAGGG